MTGAETGKDNTIREIIVVEGRDDTAAIRAAVDAETIETHGYGIREETWQLLERAYGRTGLIIFTDPDPAGERIRRRLTERFPKARQAFLEQSEAARDGDIGIENASPEAIRRALRKARGPVDAGGGRETADSGVDGSPQPADLGGGRETADSGVDCSPQPADLGGGDAPEDDSKQSAGSNSNDRQFAGVSTLTDTGDVFTMTDMDRWGLNGAPGAADRRRALGRELGIGYAGAKSFLRRLNRFGISREEAETALHSAEGNSQPQD